MKLPHQSFRERGATSATTSQNREAVLIRARFQGSYTFVSLNSRLESNKEEEELPRQASQERGAAAASTSRARFRAKRGQLKTL